jgi:hypothetical protein
MLTKVKKLIFSLDIKTGTCYIDITSKWGREKSFNTYEHFLYDEGALFIDCATVSNCRL